MTLYLIFKPNYVEIRTEALELLEMLDKNITVKNLQEHLKEKYNCKKLIYKL